MRKLMRRLIVIGSVTGLLMALNVGVALADHGNNPNSPFAEAEALAGSPPEKAATTPGAIPVGTALGFTGSVGPDDHPGLQNSKGFQNLSRNPNCPLHYLP